MTNMNFPKSTLSYWCRDISLSKTHKRRIGKMIEKGGRKGRKIAVAVNRSKRERYLRSIAKRNEHLGHMIKDKSVAKTSLAMLYLGDGSKSLNRGSLTFGNSNPFIISLFLDLLRYCYNIDETRFRCTVQCRADQCVEELERFWSWTTKIPISQFYKARIDARTKGKKSKKQSYKGVCRIDYFSAEIFIELMQIPQIVNGAHSSAG